MSRTLVATEKKLADFSVIIALSFIKNLYIFYYNIMIFADQENNISPPAKQNHLNQ
jgi:hypothetical protein